MISLTKSTKAIFLIFAFFLLFVICPPTWYDQKFLIYVKPLLNNHGSVSITCHSESTRFSFLMMAQHLSKLHLFKPWTWIFCNFFSLDHHFKIIRFIGWFRMVKQPRPRVFEETFNKNNSFFLSLFNIPVLIMLLALLKFFMETQAFS